MPIRITGMNSGLDTESIITALTQTQQDRVDTLSTMRFSTAYTKKTTTSSNTSAVSVVTGSNAMNTSQTLDINSLSKASYLTGRQINADNGEDTTMEELGISSGTLKFYVGTDSSNELSVDISSSDTIFLKEL